MNTFTKHLAYCGSLLASILILIPGPSFAIPFIYDVDRVVGEGSVRGFIQVNRLGILTDGANLDWNLHLDDGRETQTLLGPSSGGGLNSFVAISGTGFVATSDFLTFDFDRPLDDVRFETFFPTFPTAEWRLFHVQTGGVESVFIRTGFDFHFHTGTVVIGTRVRTNNIPEPSTAYMFGSGLAGLAGYRWSQARRHRRLSGIVNLPKI